MNRKLKGALTALLIVLAFASAHAGEPAEDLGRALGPWLRILDSRIDHVRVNFRIREKRDGGEALGIRYVRDGDDRFELELEHDRYGFRLRRDERSTDLLLPRHGVAFTGNGDLDPRDHLRPVGSLSRLVSDRTLVRAGVRWAADLYAAANVNPRWAGRLLLERLGVRPGDRPGRWLLPGWGRLEFAEDLLRFETDRYEGTLQVALGEGVVRGIGDEYVLVPVERAELERTISRGFRRALEVLAPAGAPAPVVEREVEHGRQLLVDGQRVVLLAGTPEEIGAAHAKLLGEEAILCVDSTVRLTGLAYTVEKGRWFLNDLRDAYARLAPWIPEDHKREVDALADGLGVPRETVRLANVFPELFHCSGFAVFGSATADGKLYHGRVLDYMTEIGLQDCAVVFVVAPEGKRRFVNVGYAGFTGSVSGMNESGISLGEMGGRGEGNWDGVPMATLMRRALEECDTLDEVLALWEKGPRTCEYYYVFADGKIPDAVGVAATPDSFEVIRAGEAHPRLGEGIADTVVLSAGSRLERLRARIEESHGEIDAEKALWLMSRPVAMRSNLHNVLFVPEDLVLLVAQAGRDRPAAEMPYAKIDFAALLRRLPR